MSRVGYARLSTEDQNEGTNTLEQQISRLRKAGATDILQDIESGRKDSRKNYRKLMSLVEKGMIEELIITRIDRLSRDAITAMTAAKKIYDLGVKVSVLDGSFDLSNANGKLNVNLQAVLAQFEVDMLSDRVKHGWNHFMANRTALHPPFGYVKKDNKYRLDTESMLTLADGVTQVSRAEVAKDFVQIFLEVRSLRASVRYINDKYGEPRLIRF